MLRKKRFAVYNLENPIDLTDLPLTFTSDIPYTVCPVGFHFWSDSILIRMTLLQSAAPGTPGILAGLQTTGFHGCNFRSCQPCMVGVGLTSAIFQYISLQRSFNLQTCNLSRDSPIFSRALTNFEWLFFLALFGLECQIVKGPKQKEVRKCNCFEIALSVKMTFYLQKTN